MDNRQLRILYTAHLLQHPLHHTFLIIYFVLRAAFHLLQGSIKGVRNILVTIFSIITTTTKGIFSTLKSAINFVWKLFRLTIFIATHLVEILAVFIPFLSLFFGYFSVDNVNRIILYLSNPSRIFVVLAVVLLIFLLLQFYIALQLLFRSKELARTILRWILALVYLLILVLTIQLAHELIATAIKALSDQLTRLDPRLYYLGRHPRL